MNGNITRPSALWAPRLRQF